MHMYELSITLDDIEGNDPADAAPSIVRWLRDNPTHDVYVKVTDSLTGVATIVCVPGDKPA